VASEAAISPVFKEALAAVTESGRRSRQMIYFTLFIEFFSLFTIREARFPRWMNARLHTMIEYYDCTHRYNASPTEKTYLTPSFCESLKEKYNDIMLDTANSAAEETARSGSSIEQPLLTSETYRHREQELLKLSVEDLGVPIPLLGVRVDANDVWIFAGPMTLLFILVLTFTLRSDINNIRLAKDQAGGRDDELELLSATIVLGRQGSEEPTNYRPSRLTSSLRRALRRRDITGYHLISTVVVLLPILNMTFLVYSDFIDGDGTRGTSPLLLGPGPGKYVAVVEILSEIASFIALIVTLFSLEETSLLLRETSLSVSRSKSPVGTTPSTPLPPIEDQGATSPVGAARFENAQQATEVTQKETA